MRVPAVDCDAPPEHVWALISRPERWSEWSPQVSEHEVEGTAAPWSLVALAYAPIVGLIARNIARVAERSGGTSR